METTSLISGIVIIIILCASLILGLLLCRHLNKKPPKDNFSQEQMTNRARSYQLAFWMMVVYFIANGLCVQFAGARWADELTICLVGVFLGVGVFAGYSIWQGAYLNLQQRPAKICLAFILIGAINIYYAYTIIRDDTVMFQDGMMTFYSINLWLGILFFVLGILIAIRYKDELKG